ncbi:MAG: hypothetical protein IPK19_05215 [Chloroflexi bacterium]|nr:hypothetical protein [Chloroflexota bacterium]
MEVTRQGNSLIVHASRYTLTCPDDRPFVHLYAPDQELHERNALMSLFVASSVNTRAGQDDTTTLGDWQVEREPRGVSLIREGGSSVWRGKLFRFRLTEERLAYTVEVEGAGTVTSVDYFGGYCSGLLRWGSGNFWSGQRFSQGFNPEPYTDEINLFSPDGGSVIDLTGVPLPNKGSWFFTPPPFCFAFESPGGWLGLGVEAAPGENRYCEFAYRGQRGAFTLALDYAGYLTIDGRYALPSIGIDFADDPYGAIAAHAHALRAQNLAPMVDRPSPAWWHEPIFCGWGAQCGLARHGGGPAPSYARQEHYEGFMRALESKGILPGVVVIDDKWQAAYGDNAVDIDKWPDLAGFVTSQHDAGRRVLLWLKAWDPDGLPPEECVTNAAGRVVAADLTSPAYERRLRSSVEHMLSPGGLDADGFKIDFTARIPASPGLRSAGDVWGLELMRRYLEVIYSTAKRVKPDALIIAHTPHPYLADVVDMIRLNDINIGKDVNEAMLHRAHIASIACPNALLDTDNWPITDREAWRRYLPLQVQLGTPTLYFVTEIDTTGEPLDDDDYALLRQTWSQYRASLPPLTD